MWKEHADPPVGQPHLIRNNRNSRNSGYVSQSSHSAEFTAITETKRGNPKVAPAQLTSGCAIPNSCNTFLLSTVGTTEKYAVFIFGAVTQDSTTAMIACRR